MSEYQVKERSTTTQRIGVNTLILCVRKFGAYPKLWLPAQGQVCPCLWSQHIARAARSVWVVPSQVYERYRGIDLQGTGAGPVPPGGIGGPLATLAKPPFSAFAAGGHPATGYSVLPAFQPVRAEYQR